MKKLIIPMIISLLLIPSVFAVGYGEQEYGDCIYGSDDRPCDVSKSVKIFLIELYITFEAVAFVFLLRGIQKENALVYIMTAMGLFFTLSVIALRVEKFVSPLSFTSFEAMAINFGLGMLCIVYLFAVYMETFRKGVTQ